MGVFDSGSQGEAPQQPHVQAEKGEEVEQPPPGAAPCGWWVRREVGTDEMCGYRVSSTTRSDNHLPLTLC